MQLTNGHIMDPSFVNDPSSETGGSRCKTRCPSAVMVKLGPSQYSGEQCVTKTQGGLAVLKPQEGQQWGEVWQGWGWRVATLPDCPSCTESLGQMKNTSHPAFENHPLLWSEEVNAFQQWGSHLKHPPELPFPSTYHTSDPLVPLVSHLRLLMPCYETCHGHLLAQ